MKKILLSIISTLLCTSFVGTGMIQRTASGIREIKQKDSYTFLVCGIDNAAENTDAIIVFNYNVNSNIASFVQIPRDTYFNFENGIDKINSIYPSMKARGKESKDAMKSLSNAVSQALNIEIDGFMCFTIDAMERLIDAIGGVDINLPYSIDVKDSDGNNHVVFSEGVHHLNGEEAIRFIRYRAGYALGDLGRIDAQKFFLSAFVSKLKGAINLKLVAKSAFKTDGGVITDVKLVDILGIALKLRGRIKECSVQYSNLPGVAEQSEDGRWFYFVNKNASYVMLTEMKLTNSSVFDSDEKLLNSKSNATIDYYFNNHTKWRILTESDLLSFSVKEKSA